MKIFILALLHHKYHLITKLPLKRNVTNLKNVNFVTMQDYSPHYSYEKIINVDKIIYNKLTTLPQCDVYPMLWMFSDIDGYNWILAISLCVSTHTIYKNGHHNDSANCWMSFS